MLTLFALPKPFKGIYRTIQENAIQSWLKLDPAPEIFLFGDEEGTEDIAQKYNILHFPNIKRNSAGTPYVNDIFSQAADKSSHVINCYVNSDIIFEPTLITILDKSIHQFPRCLQIAQRWDITFDESPDFNDPNWYDNLVIKVRTGGMISDKTALDVFVYPKDLYQDMPPFTIGWPGGKYDNWIIWYARKKGLPVIDFTDASMIIHQNHPENPRNKTDENKMTEHIINLKLAGGYGHCYDIGDASHRMTEQFELIRNSRPKGFVWRYLKRILQFIIDPLRYRIFYRV